MKPLGSLWNSAGDLMLGTLNFFYGLTHSYGMAIILLTVAELFGANAGLGRFVQYYADFADYPKMVAGILYTGLITWLAMSALDAVKRRALFWVRA